MASSTSLIIGTSLCLAIRTLLAQLSVCRFDTIQKTDRSRDVLRDFYQDLVPEELRKSGVPPWRQVGQQSRHWTR